MVKIVILSFFSLFAAFSSAAELIDLSVDELTSMQESNPIIVDIRTKQEWDRTGIIPSSLMLEFFSEDGKYDAEKWVAQLKQMTASSDRPVVLVCRSGNRSRMVGNFLTRKLGMENIYHLEKGIQSWIAAGNQPQKDCSDMVACANRK
ncbi:MAG: rhodanese-like domain-containing protein [Gammaproteobacteria bacterium]